MSCSIESITQEDFARSLELYETEHDGFARTFIAKANALGLWPHAVGAVGDMDTQSSPLVQAAIVVRVSKRRPLTANLQLLHTFHQFRRQGLAKRLTEHEFDRVYHMDGVEYFRVSAEQEALPFYRSLGFKFWGLQKSGSALSMFRIAGPAIAQGEYNFDDPVLQKALFSGRRGSLVEKFEEPH